MNNDDISHFSTIPASFAIKSNVYFITHQYLIINNSQSQRALSVSVRTVLWIYFASRQNCGLLPLHAVYLFLAKDLFKLWTTKYKKADLIVGASFFEIYSGKVSFT